MELTNNHYEFLQLKVTKRNARKRFMAYRWTIQQYGKINLSDYWTAYAGEIPGGGRAVDILDRLYSMFNDRNRRPPDYEGRSMSASDVIVLRRNGTTQTWYCDDAGFQIVKIETGKREISKKYAADYYRYIHSQAWREVADKRMELDNHTCCVCGKPATEVHHLTYDRLKNERMDDLVSLCHECHTEAETLYDPAVTPWAMEEVKPNGNNFMAAMRVDAQNIAPKVFDYITRVRGADFDSLMMLRQPPAGGDKRKYWDILSKAVNALCRKRYSKNIVEDRQAIMLETLMNHTETICLAQIEHQVRNAIQHELHETVMAEYEVYGKWIDVWSELNISAGTGNTLRGDDGTSFGPSLRETVLHYYGLDAAAGIRPKKFDCLTDDDYRVLNAMADHAASVSGQDAFRGEDYRG